MSVLSHHLQQISEALENYEAKIRALDTEIISLKLTDHNARHLAFLLRLREDYRQILQRYSGLAEGCRAITLGEASLDQGHHRG